MCYKFSRPPRQDHPQPIRNNNLNETYELLLNNWTDSILFKTKNPYLINNRNIISEFKDINDTDLLSLLNDNDIKHIKKQKNILNTTIRKNLCQIIKKKEK